MVKFKTKRLFSLQKGKEEKRSSIYLLLQAKICRDCSVIQKSAINRTSPLPSQQKS